MRYVALAREGFEMTEKAKSYFARKDIKIVDFKKRLGILILEARKPMNQKWYKYIEFFELDRRDIEGQDHSTNSDFSDH